MKSASSSSISARDVSPAMAGNRRAMLAGSAGPVIVKPSSWPMPGPARPLMSALPLTAIESIIG